jgi:hypothetical protein
MIVVVLAGCGHDAAKDSPAATGSTSGLKPNNPIPGANGKKPCEYITRADAEAAVELALPQTNENIVTGQCDYNSKEFYGSTLTVGTWEGVTQSLTAEGSRFTPVKVSGIGDEALKVSPGLLFVRKGDRGMSISLNSPAINASADKVLARETALALKILPGL